MRKRASVVPLPKLKEKAQEVFNRYVRLRDREQGCICFGCRGEAENAGHYFSVGMYGGLRYEEENVHGQCVACNKWRHGNLIHYRQGLVLKIGEEKVRELEAKAGEARMKKWTRAELEELIQSYKEKIKKLQNNVRHLYIPDDTRIYG